MNEQKKHSEKDFEQVCIYVGAGQVPFYDFRYYMKSCFNVRVIPLEVVPVAATPFIPEGRTDLVFAVHTDDIERFTDNCIRHGMLTIEAAIAIMDRLEMPDMYPAHVRSYIRDDYEFSRSEELGLNFAVKQSLDMLRKGFNE